MNTLQIIQKVFGNNDVSEKWLEKQYEFAEIVAVAEREACATLAEEFYLQEKSALAVAVAIRARGDI